MSYILAVNPSILGDAGLDSGAGIGVFIFFIGLQNAGIVGDNAATLVSAGDWSTSVVLALIGFIIVIALIVKKVKGSLLIAIGTTWVLGIIAQLAGIYQVNPDVGNYSLIPDAIIALPPSIAPTFAQCFAFGEIFAVTCFLSAVSNSSLIRDGVRAYGCRYNDARTFTQA